jgi:hypothetical protein
VFIPTWETRPSGPGLIRKVLPCDQDKVPKACALSPYVDGKLKAWPFDLWHLIKEELERDVSLSHKAYVKPPAPAQTVFTAQIVVVALFLPLGPAFIFVAEGQARIVVVLFALIWSAACIAILVSSVKALELANAPSLIRLD